MPVEMDIASEYRYRNPVVGPEDLVIGITQSGETADTLAAMRLARDAGAKVLAVTNIMGSQATRDADAVLYTRAGLEISVAATKTFVAQVAAMYLIGLRLAELRGTLPAAAHRRAGRRAEGAAVEDRDDAGGVRGAACAEVAATHSEQQFFLYLGRHIGLPVCLEGALKLKEVSYIPTDAYAAGEMKHGPIALLDESTPVVCVATDSPVLDKVLSNVEEVRARGAQTIAIATEGASGPARSPTRRSRSPAPTGSCSRSSRSCRCSCSPTTSPAPAASTSTSRATWPRRSRSSSAAGKVSRDARLASRLRPCRGCGGPALSPAAGAVAPAPTRPAVAPPKSPLFVEVAVQPQGERQAERRIAGQERRRNRRPRRA